MKNTLFLICAGLMLSVAADAQTKKKSAPAKVKVPETVDASFKGTYAVAENNKWSKNYTGNYVAVFTNANNQEQTTEYNTAGVLIKSKTTLDLATLPEVVTMAVEKKFPGATIAETVKVEIPGLAPYYRTKVKVSDTKEKVILISEEGAVTY